MSYVHLQHIVENLQLQFWRNGRSHLEENLTNMVPNPRIFTTISNFLNILLMLLHVICVFSVLKSNEVHKTF